MTRFVPADLVELRDAVAAALAAEEPVELVGGGSKRGLGRPLQTAHALDLSRLSGIRDYAPSELVLTAGAATPLAEIERAEEFGADILRLCVAVGGVLTGEHGVGVEKRDLMGAMFDETDLAHQERLKCAFDPDGLLNPGKVFPQLHRCAELGRLHVHAGRVAFPDIPRF